MVPYCTLRACTPTHLPPAQRTTGGLEAAPTRSSAILAGVEDETAMKLAPSQIREYLRSSLWFIPALCAAGAFALAQGLLAADEAISQERDTWFLFGGGPDSARSLLSTIAASMITFTAVVFSITMLVLQLASQQFSPRVLRTFLRDRATQTVLGVFIGTLTYALLVLRRVRSESEVASVSAFVPSLSIWVALLLVLTCLALFVYYIHHMAQSIRAVTIIDRVAQETRRAIDHMYPEEVGDEPEEPVQWPPAPPSLIIPSPGPPGVDVDRSEDDPEELARGLDASHGHAQRFIRDAGDHPAGLVHDRPIQMAHGIDLVIPSREAPYGQGALERHRLSGGADRDSRPRAGNGHLHIIVPLRCRGG